jgi:pimeloyl-ACP methyl ester carboxylesterase
MQVASNGQTIEVDDRGPKQGPVILMLMGLGMQLIAWPEELVDDLVQRGFRVLRIDNRDVGLSSGPDHLGKPKLLTSALLAALRLPVPSPYKLADMARDAVGVLDALHIHHAHVVGASMGGMLAQHLASSHADRVKSLTLMMTTSGARHLPQPSLEVRRALMSRPDARDPQALVRHLRKLFAVIGSPGYPTDPARLDARLLASIQRAYRPQGTTRQLLAILADGDRTKRVSSIRQPTLVIHGREDVLIPVQAGRELAELIAGAEWVEVPGMGHDLPQALLPTFAKAIARTVERAPSVSTASV